MIHQFILSFDIRARTTQNISRDIADVLAKSKVRQGLCHVFLQHTSASLMLCENYDTAVQHDLETFMQHLVPDGDKMFTHTIEGPDDMPAHIRSVITHNDLTIPIKNGKLVLGTWQGIFLWEHRASSHHRSVTVTIMGE